MAWTDPFRIFRPRGKTPPGHPISQHQTRWLAITALVTLAPLAQELPLWLAALCFLGVGWRGWLLWRKTPLPPLWLVNLLALAGAAGIGLAYRGLFGMYPGVALLSLFLALKLFEARSRRDGFVVLLLELFLDLSQFFFSQSMFTGLLMTITVFFVIVGLVLLEKDDLPLPRLGRLAAGLLVQAIPFMVVLFLFVPRIPGPLWGLPTDAYSAQSGLSDTMSPGSISQLSQSEAIAFRVHFEGPLPPRDHLYWRGPVLNEFDGRTWRMGPPGAPLNVLPYPLRGETINYDLTLEPHNRAWLLALDYPAAIPPDTLLSPSFQLVSRRLVRDRQRFRLSAQPDVHPGLDESPRTLALARRLPASGNPRARQWAAELRQRYPSDAALAAAILVRIRSDNFIYTLSPPLLGNDVIDEFLFDTRRGFCEHYASAFVFVLRAAGIPARVVTGYQGGEINPVDGYLEVRQSDAHAWAEMWLEGKGWQRVDPTAAIAPERVERNLAAALPAGEPRPVLAQANFDWARQLRFRYEAVANTWNQWVLGYDETRQRSLLSWLGLPDDINTLGALLAASTGILLLLLTGWTLRQRARQDPLQMLWEDFCRRLAKQGLPRQPWEGPADYAKRITARWPRREAEITALCTLYQALRYGGGNHHDGRRKLKAMIRAFRP